MLFEFAEEKHYLRMSRRDYTVVTYDMVRISTGKVIYRFGQFVKRIRYGDNPYWNNSNPIPVNHAFVRMDEMGEDGILIQSMNYSSPKTGVTKFDNVNYVVNSKEKGVRILEKFSMKNTAKNIMIDTTKIKDADIKTDEDGKKFIE